MAIKCAGHLNASAGILLMLVLFTTCTTGALSGDDVIYDPDTGSGDGGTRTDHTETDHCPANDPDCSADGSRPITSQTLTTPGHLQPLGSHQPPEPDLVEVPIFLSPEVFYEDFVSTDTPVVFRQVLSAERRCAFNSDYQLRTGFGHLELGVEEMKKERRGGPARTMLLADFLDQYNTTEVYMADSLPQDMRSEWHVPAMLLCGGFVQHILDVRVWFSSGGTSSVLHVDSSENLHCVVDGVKRFVLIDRAYRDQIGMDRKQDGSFKMDVDGVDMTLYNMTGVPWWNVTVEAGDCIYIPYLWLHQVRSYQRNIGINTWWRRMTEFDPAECDDVARKFNCRTSDPEGCAAGVPLADLSLTNELDHIKAQFGSLADEEDRIYKVDFLTELPNMFPGVIDGKAAEQLYLFFSGGDTEYFYAKESLTTDRIMQASEEFSKIMAVKDEGLRVPVPNDGEVDDTPYHLDE